MKFMSDFREAMWGVVQSAVSELDFDFTEYGSKHFTRMAAIAADQSFERCARGGAWRLTVICRTPPAA